MILDCGNTFVGKDPMNEACAGYTESLVVDHFSEQGVRDAEIGRMTERINADKADNKQFRRVRPIYRWHGTPTTV